MKRKTIIIIIWCLWACSLIIGVICVNNHINNKRIKLMDELQDGLEKLFEGQDYMINWWNDNDNGLFEEVYSGNPVSNYNLIDIPPKMEPLTDGWEQYDNLVSLYKQNVEEWERVYGDIFSLYELNWDDEYPNDKDEGWNIMRTHYSGVPDDLLQVNTIFPYKVGLRKTKNGNSYTLEQAVNKSFELYTTDKRSKLYGRYSSNNSIWPKIYDCCNRYYSIVENTNYDATKKKGSNSAFLSKDNPPLNPNTDAYECGKLLSDFYSVFIATTPETHYMIQEKEEAISEDRIKLLLWCCVGLSILFLSAIIPLTITEKKSKSKT